MLYARASFYFCIFLTIFWKFHAWITISPRTPAQLLSIHQSLAFRYTAFQFSSHINIFLRQLRVSNPWGTFLKNTHILLQSHSVVINNQGLNTDEVHVQVSPTVLILSFGAILFSAPGTLGLDVVCSYCVSRDLNSFSVSFMSFGVQGEAWFLFQSLPVDIWGFPIFHYRKTILWGICFCTPHGAFT